MQFKPDTDTLYLCDNGACYCGAHLGASATATGRDISGQPIVALTPDVMAEAVGADFMCEAPRCGKATS